MANETTHNGHGVAQKERMFVALAIGSVILVFTTLAIAWFLWYQTAAAECRRAAEGRADNRAMWEFLIDERANPDDPFTDRFVQELDLRLPARVCKGTTLVDVTLED